MVEISKIVKEYGAIILGVAALLLSNWNQNLFYISLLLFGIGIGYLIRSLEANAEIKPRKEKKTESDTFEYLNIEYPYTIHIFDDGSKEVTMGKPKCFKCRDDIDIHQASNELIISCPRCDEYVEPGNITYKDYEDRIATFILQEFIEMETRPGIRVKLTAD